MDSKSSSTRKRQPAGKKSSASTTGEAKVSWWRRLRQTNPPAGWVALILFCLSVYILLVSIWPHNSGFFGGFLHSFLGGALGRSKLLFALSLLLYSIGLLLPVQLPGRLTSFWGLFFLQISVLLGDSWWSAFRGLDLGDPIVRGSYGGGIGAALYSLIFGFGGSLGVGVVLFALLLTTASMLTRIPPALVLVMIGRGARRAIPSPEQAKAIRSKGQAVLSQVSQAVQRPPTPELAEPSAELLLRQDELTARVAALSQESVQRSAEEKADPLAIPQPHIAPEEEEELLLPSVSPGIVLPLATAELYRQLEPSAVPDQVPIEPTPKPEDPLPSQLNPAILMEDELVPLNEEELQLFYEGDPLVGNDPWDDDEAPLPIGGVPHDIDTATLAQLMSSMTSGAAMVRYQPPPLGLLTKPLGNPGLPPSELASNSLLLEQTLDQFGVKAKVLAISQGPAVTRYELQLAPGIRVSKVASLADDIALSLAAVGVRIEAPIPGKAAIGIEVPNKVAGTVMLSEILHSQEYSEAKTPLTVALGKDIAGKPVVIDLARMPHLLLAGTTGSGKSVTMNTIICSILYRCSPDQVRLIMVDPKVVEMQNYNGIPHLLAPVVTDPKKAAAVLKIATKEMDKRYELFSALNVKNIVQFNEKIAVLKNNPDINPELQEVVAKMETIPYWVLFIDELADLMMIARDEVERSIIRISQLARAAGIHLVVGTQRPTTDVITGIIKGNIPSRIAFVVSAGIDSRIILDTNGAEKLLGKGDMLFMPIGSFKPIRVQGAFISEEDIDAIVAHVKAQGTPVYNEEILHGGDEDEATANDYSERDPLIYKAAHLIVEARLGSTSFIQRRLNVGFSRAGRIMDQLQELGVVGPPNGSKPRDVLFSLEQVDQLRSIL